MSCGGDWWSLLLITRRSRPGEGDLTAAAELLRASVERAAEHAQSFTLVVTLCYCGDVLLERPDLADIAAMVEAIEVAGRFDASLPRATLVSTRWSVRFAGGRSAAAIANMRGRSPSPRRWESAMPWELDAGTRRRRPRVALANRPAAIICLDFVVPTPSCLRPRGPTA